MPDPGRSRLWRAVATSAVVLAGESPAAVNPALSVLELVLHEHAGLKVHTANGTLTVLAGSGIARSFMWKDCTMEAHMSARGARWMGSLGIYDPSPGGTEGTASHECQGISRTVAQEGQIHFPNEPAALEWLGRYADTGSTAWTSDGLVVQWFLVPARQQLNVDVWQICIAGHYPARLNGSSDADVMLISPTNARQARRNCTLASRATILQTREAWQQLWHTSNEVRSCALIPGPAAHESDQKATRCEPAIHRAR